MPSVLIQYEAADKHEAENEAENEVEHEAEDEAEDAIYCSI